MPRIRLEPTGRTVEAVEGETILDVLNRIGTPVDSVCGGRGKCGRCQVKVLSDLPLPTDDDVAHIPPALLRAGMRLACRLAAADGLVIEAPEHAHVAKAAILEACEAQADISPAVEARKVAVPLPTLESPTSRMERLIASIEKELGLRPRLPLNVLEDLSRMGDPKEPIGVVLRADEVLHLSTSTRTPIYGVAVDVGTTTVVAYLVDLASGQTIAVRSQLNPQVRFGDDVISRITYARANPDGIRNLQRLIIGSIDGLIAGCCDAAGISREEVYEVMLVGNTSMHHSVFGLDQTSLAFAPFAPIETVGLNYKASELGLTIAREGYAVALPNVAGFVGADHISVLLATQLDKLGVPAIAIDIGTNGEVSVSNGDRIACASVAAGPAFEGANLSCGMRGMEGAIDHVSIGPDLQPIVSTIGDTPPRGVCGSGIIDLVAELV
ncbi:MAG TPA: ASKHA domain-containing protein, partial [Methanomassiliicoccales archaeon]|nr:ASKHA domain-containing protein [Methanomassiliicoccales archaeon]